MSNEKKNRIGVKGLENIFGDGINDLINNIEQSPEIQRDLGQEISIAKVIPNPYQPRVTFDSEQLKELSDSIKLHGLIQPIVVRKTGNGGFYQLIAGERRTKASKLAGLKKIKAVVIDISESQLMEFALIENIQRVDLNAFEEAQAYQNLITKMKWTQEQLAQKVNKSRPHIANTLRILQLPAEVLKMVKDDKLTMGHVKPLLQLAPNVKLILAIANRAIEEKWNVRKVEDVVKAQSLIASKKNKTFKSQDIYLVELENTISKKLNTRVKIDNKKVIIKFDNNKDLNRILEKLNLLD